MATVEHMDGKEHMVDRNPPGNNFSIKIHEFK